MSEISSWFNNEVSRWRSGAALVWTIVLTPVMVYTTVAIANINLFNPIEWISSGILRALSVWTWPYVAVIVAGVAVLTLQTSRQLTVIPEVHSSRWARLCSVCRPKALWSVAMTAVVCGVLAWTYTKLVVSGYDTLTVQCPHDDQATCLNQHHVFVILHGVYVGVAYKMATILTGQNQLQFPTLQQSKFFVMKRSAVANIVKAGTQSLHRLKYFYVLYYLLLGSLVQNFFADKFSLEMSSPRVDSLTGLLDVCLLWHSALSGTLTLALLASATQLLKLYYTQWHQFPVQTSIERYHKLCLPHALGCQHNSLVQYHGYQDLVLLSRHSSPRRAQIFSLSQLGGHPQTWADVSRECLGLLERLLDAVRAYNVRVMADGSMKHLAGDAAGTAGPNNNGLTQRSVPKDDVSVKAASPPNVTKSTPLQLLTSDLKKKRLVSFFLAEDLDAGSRALFAQCQLYIWAVDALSHLAVASYTEDRFGVVQKSLKNIVEMLLNLQEQVEKHQRLVAGLGKRAEGEGTVDHEAALRAALKNTLKGAVYRVVTTFHSHIRSIPLSGEHIRKLNHFLDYKE